MSRSIIDTIYSTALDGESWDNVLHGVRELTGVRLVSLLQVDSTMTVRSFTGVGDDPGWLAECLTAYGMEYRNHDPAGDIVANWPIGKWFDDAQHVTQRERDRGIFHQEFLRPRDLGYWQGVWVERAMSDNSFMAMIGASDAKPLSDELRAEVDSINTHLRRALHMQTRLNTQQPSRPSMAEATLDTIAVPLFLLDDNRKLLLTNESARALTRKFPVQLRFVDDRFMPAGWSEPTQWKMACIRGHIELPGGAESIPPLYLHLTPVPPQSALARTWQRPLTLMSSNAVTSDERVAHLLQRQYGLTPTEVDICLSLCRKGLSPKECADLRGVTIATIRSQIAAIHAKVGVRRHQELLLTVAGLCDRLTVL